MAKEPEKKDPPPPVEPEKKEAPDASHVPDEGAYHGNVPSKK